MSRVAVAERHETLVAAFEAFRREPVFGQGNIRQAREAAFKRFQESDHLKTLVKDYDAHFEGVSERQRSAYVQIWP